MSLSATSAVSANRVDLRGLQKKRIKVPYLGALSYYIHKTPGLTEQAPAPVLVLLHGLGSQPHSWIVNGDVINHIDKAVRSGVLPACWVVMPEGRSGYWSDWSDGKHPWGSWIHQHLLDALTRAGMRGSNPALTAVVGISMGGFGAMSLGLLRPDRIGFAAGLSATDLDIATQKPPFRPVYRSVLGSPISSERMRSVNPYQLVRGGAGTAKQRYLLAWGDREPPKFSVGSERLVAAMRARKLNLSPMIVHQGAHGWRTTWLVAQPWWLRELGAWWKIKAKQPGKKR